MILRSTVASTGMNPTVAYIQASPPQCKTKGFPAAPCHDSNGRGRSGGAFAAGSVACIACLGCPFTRNSLWSQDATDMFTHLLRNRIIFIGQRINDEVRSSPTQSAMPICMSQTGKRTVSPYVCLRSWPHKLLPVYSL